MRALCGVCKQAEFKYTCPRCEIVYCSLSCYQSHGQCTENFFQQQVQEELQSQKATGEERKRLEQIVSQLNRLDVEDDEEADDESDEEAAERRLEDLLEKADYDALTIDDLTEEELRTFNSELKRGSIGQLLEAWEPWWQRAGVVEIESSAAVESSGRAFSDTEPLQHIPQCREVPHVCCANGQQPHNSVAFTALAVFYAYAHTVRAFNGEWACDPLEAAPHLLHLCPAICAHRVHESTGECLRTCVDAAATLPGGGFGKAFDLHLLADVGMLIRGVDFAMRALQETTDLLEKCKTSGGGGKGGRLKRGLKKLEFLTSYVFHHFDNVASLADDVARFLQQRESECRKEQEAQHVRNHGGIVMPHQELHSHTSAPIRITC